MQLQSRILHGDTAEPLAAIPYPVILGLKEGGFAVLGAGSSKGRVRLIDPIARSAQDLAIEEARALSSGEVVLITRRLGGAGADPNTFGFRWSSIGCRCRIGRPVGCTASMAPPPPASPRGSAVKGT